jgi:aspartate aminotransferase
MKLKGAATDTDFSAMILNEAEVALVPGSAFGADGYLRFSFATSMEILEEAVARITRFMG